jgi:hypothetical protein
VTHRAAASTPSQHYYAVWTAPIGAAVGVSAAVIAGVHELPSSTPDVAAVLLVAIVFSTASWGRELFLPGYGGESSPSGVTRVIGVATAGLIILWPLAPVIALAADGTKNDFVVGVVFASMGSESCYALMAGMVPGMRERLARR